MSKAFTKENDDAEAELPEAPEPLPKGQKNYMTPHGARMMEAELHQLMRVERPKVVETVAWAASNGDRSENGDYIYGKKRLREIDRRGRYIGKRLESAVIVDPEQQQGLEKVFFGATVTYVREDDSEHTVKLVGVDEADMNQHKISWISPVARALMKAQIGDTVVLHTPAGAETIEILDVSYPLD